MIEEDELPTSLCKSCAHSIINVEKFKRFCLDSTEQWSNAVLLLDSLPKLDELPNRNKGVYAILESNKLTVLNIYTEGLDRRAAAVKLRNRFARISGNNQNEIDKKQYHCPDCTKPFLGAHNLYLHLMESSEDKRACCVCGVILTRSGLIQHLITIHNREPYVCDKCPALFKSAKTYVSHLGKVHMKGGIRCVDCGRSYQSQQAFNAHQAVHQTKTCPNCNIVFRNLSCFTYHTTQCEATAVNGVIESNTMDKRKKMGRTRAVGGKGKTECFCDVCGKRFAAKKYILAHMQNVHSTSTHSNCVYCGKYLAAAHMTEHVKQHELIRTYTCNYCGLVLKTNLGIKQHLRLHTGEKPYVCKVCGEAFSASSRRSAHMRKVHEKINKFKHYCTQCDAKFQRPYQLKNHMRQAHLQSNCLNFTCEYCGDKFGSANGLGHHKRKHQDVYQVPNLKIGKNELMFEVHSQPVDVNILVAQYGK